ncbi:MarR family transcriptional regulator [Streptomyces sp. 150FB]|uniref:MarR family winged helix-turn-helix transcriptional regulator n=1 Tax=Streptomyces sp. 150FB TaxID=1576605 RepID=UPI00099D6472|nr:MarR family transcriptional regulator [Streptomyces sp. 150FB]
MTEQGSDGSAEDAFFTELASAYGKTRQAFAQHVGMSLPRLRMLMTLRKAGETSHSDLRGIVSLDGASVTRLVKEFESEGLVTRRVDPEDNRYVLASLTPAGEGAAAELDQRHQEFQHRLLDGIAPREQRNLRRALRRLSANVDRITGDDDT